MLFAEVIFGHRTSIDHFLSIAVDLIGLILSIYH